MFSWYLVLSPTTSRAVMNTLNSLLSFFDGSSSDVSSPVIQHSSTGAQYAAGQGYILLSQPLLGDDYSSINSTGPISDTSIEFGPQQVNHQSGQLVPVVSGTLPSPLLEQQPANTQNSPLPLVNCPSPLVNDYEIMPILLEIRSTVNGLSSEMRDVKATVARLENSNLSLQNKLGDLTKDITDIGDSLTMTDEKVAELEDIVTRVQAPSINSLNTSYDRLTSSHAELRLQNKQLQERLLVLETKEKQNNLLFEGIPETPLSTPHRDVTQLLTNQLRIAEASEWRFRTCYRLKSRVVGAAAPIFCSFNDKTNHDRAWLARGKLGGTRIQVKEDLPGEYNDRRRVLYPILKKAKQLGKRAFFGGDRLSISGKQYSSDQLGRIPKECSPLESAIIRGDGAIGFFGMHSPLSNFHPSRMEIQGRSYSCVEQYFQYKKCELAGKQDIAQKILLAKHPSQCKRFGDMIHLPSHINWRETSENIMLEACLVKFSQNNDCRQFLLSTADNLLFEASTDKIWGTGLSLRHASAAREDAWTGANSLGRILMRVRNSLRE